MVFRSDRQRKAAFANMNKGRNEDRGNVNPTLISKIRIANLRNIIKSNQKSINLNQRFIKDVVGRPRFRKNLIDENKKLRDRNIVLRNRIIAKGGTPVKSKPTFKIVKIKGQAFIQKTVKTNKAKIVTRRPF